MSTKTVAQVDDLGKKVASLLHGIHALHRALADVKVPQKAKFLNPRGRIIDSLERAKNELGGVELDLIALANELEKEA